MKFENYMILEIPSRSTNEGFARSAVACFAAQMDPTLEELGDIKTAVSEAVTNCIVHAYPNELGVKREELPYRGKLTLMKFYQKQLLLGGNAQYQVNNKYQL